MAPLSNSRYPQENGNSNETTRTTTEILLVDDNPADLDLTVEVMGRSGSLKEIHTVTDGAEALAFLRRQGKYASASLPNLIVLDLNLPKKDGCAVLAEVKGDPLLRSTPVVVFSTSQARHDIAKSYELGANSYISKPGNLPEFVSVIEAIEDFWFGCARLPQGENR